MKTFKYYIFLIFLFFAACVDNVPTVEELPSSKVDFTYEVIGDYAIDYYVGSDIKFTNTSYESGAATWDFGDGSPVVTGESPVHKFSTPGTYTVTLTIAGVGQNSQNILVSDIAPILTMQPVEGGVTEIKETPINLDVYLPNPENLPVGYTWIFPDGTLDANKNPITTSNLENPGTLYFNNVGSQRVILRTTLGGRLLEQGVINVQVGYNQPTKTLYYAVKGGNIMAYKLVNDLPADVKVFPFDLGVKSGQHPFNILFNDSSLYVLDAGRQFSYINDVDGVLGDGRISVVSKDGLNVEVLATNVGGAAFNDPFFGYIDPAGQMIYFSDRNTGISRLPLSTRNAVIEKNSANNRASYWVQNTSLGYYNNGYQYGAMNANFAKVGDTWWWSKTYNGVGIFKFKESDIGNTATRPASGMVADGAYMKSFVVDQTRNMVYFSVRGANGGFYAATIAQFNAMATVNDVAPYLVQRMITADEGASGEYVDISQMVLDPETGHVYFGYRKDATSTIPSGLKRYNFTTKKVESVIDNVEIYGVTINNTKAKLF